MGKIKEFLQRGISPVWAVVIIVVVAVLVATAFLVYGYFWTPETPEPFEQPETKDETSDWKTYKNEKYGFEIKYPAELVLRGIEPLSKADSVGIGAKEGWPNLPMCAIQVNKHSVDWTIDKDISVLLPGLCQNKVISDINIGGLNGKKVSFSGCKDIGSAEEGTDKIRILIIDKNGYFYQFEAFDKIGAEENKNYELIFDKMLSNFKFIGE